ncbi:Potassium voltage-gated channel subfamily C member 2, partial [Ophiophagus hannah]
MFRGSQNFNEGVSLENLLVQMKKPPPPHPGQILRLSMEENDGEPHSPRTESWEVKHYTLPTGYEKSHSLNSIAGLPPSPAPLSFGSPGSVRRPRSPIPSIL